MVIARNLLNGKEAWGYGQISKNEIFIPSQDVPVNETAKNSHFQVILSFYIDKNTIK
jgi:hypothetical protein